MNKQADNLRILAQKMKSDLRARIKGQEKLTRVITVTSGKGGVGKSNFAVNMAIALCEFKQRVILLDADMGLANVDVIMGISPAYNLAHVIAGEKTIPDVIYEGPNGVRIIPGGSGMHELANLKDWQLENFLTKLSHLEGMADYLIIDTGAGLSKTVLSFVLSADEVIVLTTTEPTSLTDAYGLIKTVRQQRYSGKVSVVVNRASSSVEATVVYNKLKIAATMFLKYSVDYLGFLREDSKVGKAVREQQPFIQSYPLTNASQDIYAMAARLCNKDYNPQDQSGVRVFFNKVAEYFR